MTNRITPTDYTDAASLLLEGAFATLFQIGNAVEANASTPSHAAALEVIQNQLGSAASLLESNPDPGTHAALCTMGAGIRAIVATLDLYRAGYAGQCDLTAPHLTRAALYMLANEVEAISAALHDLTTGEAAA